MRVAAVVLAAGASMRLGEPKQLVELQGETLLERAVRIAREAECSPVVVVLGASAEMILARCSLEEAQVIVREEWESGMGGSIAAGVAALQDVDGCVVMTCDMPAVTAQHLRLLMEAGSGGGAVASSYAGRRGVPGYFPASKFGKLAGLRGDAGARASLQDARCVELAGGELDVDTAEDLARVRTRLG